MLDSVGVDMIEAGDPSVSPNVAKAIEKIASLGLRAEVVAHSLPHAQALTAPKPAARIVSPSFMPLRKFILMQKLHKTPGASLEIIREHICYAKSLGLKVRYTPEDATRTDFEFLVQVCNAAIEAGADRISFADTLGIMQPHSMFEQVSALREALLPCKSICTATMITDLR
jgi:2-isopropylmalate synthase